MNNVLVQAIKTKIALEMINCLEIGSIDDVPDTTNYSPILYSLINKDDEKELIEYIDGEDIGLEKYNEGTIESKKELMYYATVKIFSDCFDDDFINAHFGITQFQKALKILKIDIWDLLEMKYVFKM